MSGHRAGMVCYSCGLCYAEGTHKYAIAEYLPNGWKYDEATFLVCRSCGTAHAVEHNAKEGEPDRLRARPVPFFAALSPKMRRGYKKRIRELQEQKNRKPLDTDTAPTMARRINLLPPPRWKSKIAESREVWGEKIGRAMEEYGFYIFVPFFLPGYLMEMIPDALWDKKHPIEEWQKHDPIFVTSPETFDLRVKQLHKIHKRYESLWPIFCDELPVKEYGAWRNWEERNILYSDLNCSHCGAFGLLSWELPNKKVSFPDYSIPTCPCCQQNAILSDGYGGMDTSLDLMGDIFYDDNPYGDYDKSLIPWEWIQKFSSYDAPRSETAIVHIKNGGLQPYSVPIKIQENWSEVKLPPYHTYEIHLKRVPGESVINQDPARFSGD